MFSHRGIFFLFHHKNVDIVTKCSEKGGGGGDKQLVSYLQ